MSHFLDLRADVDMGKGRVVTLMLAMALMLAVLLGVAIAVKFGGIALIQVWVFLAIRPNAGGFRWLLFP